MARTTDTRFLVRKYAQQVHEAGGTPTPALIRRMLGNKGSPNTISDELHKWQQERPSSSSATHARAASPESADAQNGDRAVEMLRLLVEEAANQRSMLQRALGGGPATAGHDGQPEVAQRLRELGEKLVADRAWLQRELELMNTRFEGAQKRALLQIEEARSEASKWRDQYRQLQSEFGTWKDTSRQRTQQLRDELAWLRGKLGLPLQATSAPALGEPAAVTPIAYQQPAHQRRPAPYPGHPRAVGGPGDD